MPNQHMPQIDVNNLPVDFRGMYKANKDAVEQWAINNWKLLVRFHNGDTKQAKGMAFIDVKGSNWVHDKFFRGPQGN